MIKLIVIISIFIIKNKFYIIKNNFVIIKESYYVYQFIVNFLIYTILSTRSSIAFAILIIF